MSQRVPSSSPSPSMGSAVPVTARRSPWRVVFWIALTVLICSLVALGYIGFSYWNGQNTYDSIVQEAFAVPEGSGADLGDFDVDWDKLRSINPDVVGWVYMPDSPISYPIAHKAGDDEYYLYHNFNGDSTGSFGAEYGSVMLSGANAADFSDQVSFVYGHNMNNGAMFAYLNQLQDEATFNAHRTLFLLTPEGNYRLTTFALDRVSETDTAVVQREFTAASDMGAYVQARIDASKVAARPAPPSVEDISQVIALSTCDMDNSYRTIVFANVDEFQASDDVISDRSMSAGIHDKMLVQPDDIANVVGSTEKRTT